MAVAQSPASTILGQRRSKVTSCLRRAGADMRDPHVSGCEKKEKSARKSAGLLLGQTARAREEEKRGRLGGLG